MQSITCCVIIHWTIEMVISYEGLDATRCCSRKNWRIELQTVVDPR